ncbi:hypothetical protein PHISCL_10329 [Aspergillus sclerotialis]|uniref:Uncharacterized protein n=1 Tax=Aspergillus sclerotialis TaxID=2070753 RepID=A0A3A2ZDB5_9EURO|nr:hypothetical protein PHISCL_10329 [Aspergillus sclerotialis]
MYIITSKLNCTPGFTFAKLNVDVPVCREDAAWNIAAKTRGPGGRLVTAGLWRSRTRIKIMSTKFNMNKIPKRAHVGRLGKRSV